MEIGRRNERKHRMHGRAIRMKRFRRPEASPGRSCRSALRCNEYVTIKKKGQIKQLRCSGSLKNVLTAIFRDDLIALCAHPKVSPFNFPSLLSRLQIDAGI